MASKAMNGKQIVTLWIGITIIALMGIYLPVHKTVSKNEAPPPSYRQVVIYDFLFKDSIQEIDYPRLLIQWLIVATITGGLMLTFNEKREQFVSSKENSKFYPSSLLAEKRY